MQVGLYNRAVGKISVVLVVFQFLLPLVGVGQESRIIKVRVVDGTTSKGLAGVNIKWKAQAIITNKEGIAVLTLPQTDKLQLSFSLLGYQSYTKELRADTVSTLMSVGLKSEKQYLQEVVVTGQETNRLSSSTWITREALKMLQPSSFSDLLELLPGGMAKDPVLTAANTMQLREVGVNEPGYESSSLGVAFMIDGAPLSSHANMQATIGESQTRRTVSGSRNMLGKGIDLRAIATDNIQEVEVIRGIPSVRYGNLTSGLVKISRKSAGSPLTLRFKSDGLSKLFYAGKGLAVGANKFVNVGIDYLKAKDSPTNPLENYSRLTAMFKWDSNWQDASGQQWKWMAALDLSSTLDKEKKDSDIGYAEVDRYAAKNKTGNLSQHLSVSRPKASWFRKITLNHSLHLEQDRIDRVKWVQLEQATAISPGREDGVHDGIFLPGNYTAHLQVDGKPLNLYGNLESEHFFTWKKLTQNWLVGAQWSMDKNIGQGHVFDPMRPLSPQMDVRPRAFKDIPASQELSFFVEDQLKYSLAAHSIEALLGLRANKILGLPAAYSMLNHWYVDPRFNIAWHFPAVDIAGNPLKITVGAGVGRASQKPVMAQISPNTVYWDIVQLNYFHDTPEFRRINFLTQSLDPTNYSLTPASTLKKELRMQATYAGVNLVASLFDESMHNGFRNMSDYTVLHAKTYQTSHLDPSTITAAPDIYALPYQDRTILTLYPKVENGSSIHKQGVEFQLSSPRFTFLNTKLTADGAWFKSQYGNSRMLYNNPRSTIIIDGQRQQYLGLYLTDKGFKNQVFHSKLFVDNYFPRIGMAFLTSLQVQWFRTNQSAYENGRPVAYIDGNGNRYPFTDRAAQDPALKQLIVNYADNAFAVSRVPMTMYVNFKATKNIGAKIRMAMYVNRLLQYNKSYTVNGVDFRARGINSPYFGMEINLNI
ncbi:TonB-dependent receptor plug domain-containing protein [Sphingobacterium sp. Mn56C]|uniref:TonB-dependent receptor plug domain-containing protein n=1 Tax=Sphingobacterium sp. Mn56C TaxID=3395261 RepID=UPI003BBEB835